MIQKQRERLIGLFHEFPRPFWILIIVTFIDRLGGFLLFPFFALYISKRFQVGMTQVGVLFALFSFSSFLGTTIGGGLTDRFGRKWILIFSLISTSFSSVIMGLVNTLQGFFLLALLVGIFTDAGIPANQAMVADLLPKEKRSQGFGLLRVVVNLSATVGPAIGGLLATRSYLMLFIADAIISLISAIIVLIWLPETRPQAVDKEKSVSTAETFRGYLDVFRDRFFLAFIGVSMLSVLVYMNISTTLGVYLRDVHGIPESGYGLIISLNAILVVLFQLPITRRTESRPPMLMMALGTLLYAIGFAMYGFISLYALFFLAMVVITIGEMIMIPVSQALASRLSPENMRGRYMAVFGFSWGIPFAFGPFLAGLLMDNFNPHWLWYVAGGVGILAVIGFLQLNRQLIIEPPEMLRGSAQKEARD